MKQLIQKEPFVVHGVVNHNQLGNGVIMSLAVQPDAFRRGEEYVHFGLLPAEALKLAQELILKAGQVAKANANQTV